MRALRIALVSDSYLPRIGGIEVHVDGLARHLARAGHTVDVVTSEPGTTRPACTVAAADRVRVHRLGVPRLPGFGIACTPGMVGALRTVLLDGDYDVVHCHGSLVSPVAVAAAYLCHRHALPCVLTHHSVLPHHALVASLDRITGWGRWPVVRTAVSSLVAAQVRRASPGTSVHVLPNAVDPQQWMVPQRSAAPDAFRIAAVQRLAARKRPLALLHVVARVAEALRARAPERRLVVRVVGDGPLRGTMRRRIRQLGLDDVVELVGWQSPGGVRALFAESDAFVLPSVRESFGLAALEARCAGLPVVARRESGVAGFVRHEREGLLATSDDDLAAQLIRLALEPALATSIARHNAGTLPRETWAAALERHLAIYRLAMRLVRPAEARVAREDRRASATIRRAAVAARVAHPRSAAGGD